MKAKKKRKDWRRDFKPWEPFMKASYPTPKHYRVAGVDEVWMNNRYQVAVRWFTDPTLGEMAYLSIKRNDREPIHDWRDLQRCKNEILGPEVEAVELYPAESRLVDVSNQFHLWCLLPAGRKWPFGWETRAVSEADVDDGAKQRPFPKDARPADLMTPEAVLDGLGKLGALSVLKPGGGKSHV